MLTVNYEKQMLLGGSLFFSSSVCMSQFEEAWNRFSRSVTLEFCEEFSLDFCLACIIN